MIAPPTPGTIKLPSIAPPIIMAGTVEEFWLFVFGFGWLARKSGDFLFFIDTLLFLRFDVEGSPLDEMIRLNFFLMHVEYPVLAAYLTL